MEINIAEIKKAEIYIDNSVISGKITEIDKKQGKIYFELPVDSPFSIATMGKRAELFFEHEGKKYFIAGKIFFQPPSKVIMTPDTDAEIEKRADKRLEAPSLPATISYHGVFHKKHMIKGTIINISLKGARIEADEVLSKDSSYELYTSFPFHHTCLQFHSFFVVRNHQPYRNIFINGVSFTDMDIESENNLKKYLFRGQKKTVF